MNQEELGREIAELMGFMHGAMQEFQTSMDELIDIQRKQTKEVNEDVSSAMTLIQNVEKHSVKMLDAQTKSLEFINKRWADGLLQKAEEAGQKQAHLFGQAIAKEVVKDVRKDLQDATHALSDKTQAFENAARWYSWQRFAFALTLVMTSAFILVWGFYFFIPGPEELLALRTEKKELEATLETLEKKGGRMALSQCGSKRKLCVKVDKAVQYKDNFMVIYGAK